MHWLVPPHINNGVCNTSEYVMYIPVSHFSAIPPPIAVNTTSNSNPNTFDVARTSGTTTYSVQHGAEFELQCSSVATEESNFSGSVIWYRTTKHTGWCV